MSELGSRHSCFSLNVEGDRHETMWVKFVWGMLPDNLFLMEVPESRFTGLRSVYPYAVYQPDYLQSTNETKGVAILSQHPMENVATHFLETDEVPQSLPKGDQPHLGVAVQATIAGIDYVATHFTYTRDGLPNAQQEEALCTLFRIFDQCGPSLIAVGDFNIPRGVSPLYNILATRLHDRIPEDVTTTIDPLRHRVNTGVKPRLSTVVDYVWTREDKSSLGVIGPTLIYGLSDHAGLLFGMIQESCDAKTPLEQETFFDHKSYATT